MAGVYSVGEGLLMKCALTIRIKVDPDRQIEKFAKGFDRLSEADQDRFSKEWRALEVAGAQVADSGFCYGVVHAWLSNDMVQHAKRFGIDL